MASWMWIAAGGALGAVGRAGITQATIALWGPRLPYGTLFVNVVGSVVLGALFAWSDRTPALGPQARSFLMTGMLGAFTTFSTFSVETIRLVQRGDLPLAIANVGANVILSVVGAAVGMAAVGHLHAGAVDG